MTKPEEIEPAMRDALAQKCPTIVNIMIDTAVHLPSPPTNPLWSSSTLLTSTITGQATRKPQEHPFELGATLGGKAKL